MQGTIGTFELIIGGSIFIFIISCLFIILYYYFSRKIIITKLQQNHLTLEHQKELLKNEIAVIEKERKRIARDLHDEIGANLAYIGLNFSQIVKEYPVNVSLSAKMSVCQSQLNQAIADVRRISHDLLPPILEMFGLIPAIQEFINNVHSSFQIEFSYDDSFNLINSEKALQLYRVLLELINNSIKHSGGDTITIRLLDLQPSGKIIYSDNGIGYDINEMKYSTGLGIKNIISRLELIEADYKCDTTKVNGFQFEILIN
jgi:two-component system, NarL family, sensor kinase